MRKVVVSMVIILCVLFFMPLIAVKVVSGDCGMGLCFILFYLVNPMLSVFMGIYSGLDIKKLWYIPLVLGVVFVLSMWIIFDMGETDFILYGIGYFVIGVIVMLITATIKRIRRK